MLRYVSFLPVLLTVCAWGAPTAVPDSPSEQKIFMADPVPLLSAAEEAKALKLPADLKVEVVASEPMIEHPVAASFDADGRMWVVEMRAYMPDVLGAGENAPTGRISILQDTDGDGKMDKVTVFLDHLVLPRAIACVRDGVLIAVPPNLIFCRADHDKCVQQTVIAKDYGISGNPEHQPNGLMPALDNWIYNANYNRRLRFENGSWVSDVVPEVGQWGICQDNYGRLYHDDNSDELRWSPVPISYIDRNPFFRADGANEQIVHDQTCWPTHVTAVDRGYLPNFVRPDGTLKIFTAACSPLVYRGGLLPKEYDGNALVCEPSANFIRRNVISEKDGVASGKNPYVKSEWLSSNYERFRPVNLYDGPDGGIYIIDMHHGLLQHKVYLTTFCKDEYLQRQLEKFMHTGRIFRIVPADFKSAAQPHLSTATTAELVAQLSNANGWWRDTAQRLLVERGDFHAVSMLRTLAMSGENPLGRLHAMWTLEGFGLRDPAMIEHALSDADPMLRAAAIRLSERLLDSPIRDTIMTALLKLVDDPSADVREQLALSLSGQGTPQTRTALVQMLTADSENPYIRDGIISGLRGHEIDFLQQLVDAADWDKAKRGRDIVIGNLTRCILAGRNKKQVAGLLDLIAGQPTSARWRQMAMLDAFPDPAEAAHRNRKTIILDTEPTKLLALRMKYPEMTGGAKPASEQAKAEQQLGERLGWVFAMVHWIGQPGYVPPPPPPPLTAEEQARYEAGRAVFTKTCMQCHKMDGLGQRGLAPPLADSEWVLGPESRILRIVMHGLAGPVTVNDQTYRLEMPAFGPSLKDEDIAAVLTYVRRSWENEGAAVAPQRVAQARKNTAKRKTPWTERELMRMN